MTMARIAHEGTADFKAEKMAADRPALGDFYADGCGP